MLEQDLLEKIVYFTEEEIDFLNGKEEIDRSIYIDSSSQVVDYHKLLLDDEQISIRKHTRFCRYPTHGHNYIELMYVYGGKMIHNIEGQEIVIEEGDLLLLNQNIQHSIEYADENDIIFNFIIKPEFLSFLSTVFKEENDVSKFIFEVLYSYDNNGEYLVFNSKNNALVQSYIEAIIRNLYQTLLNKSLQLKFLVGLLLTELMNSPELITTYSENSYEKNLVTSILKYVVMSSKKGSLNELSNQLHIPDYRLCKLIKEKTGKTFKQLIQEERLKKTCQLLENTHLPINEIMQEVGYENITFFYKIFKARYNCTPKEYRETFAK